MMRSPEEEHTLRNQIAVIVGYCELLLGEVPEDNPLHEDILELHKAAMTALHMLQKHPKQDS